jgi:tRNA A-37 threonylcarbamoyl transferase component Bud32
MNCSACGTAVDPSQRFCPKCGALVGADPSAPDPLLGTTIGGKYKIVKLLGEGGMGSVYEGEQTLGTKVRRVAIKTLHPHLSKDPKVITRFQREVGTLSELEHPNTIGVYDFGSTPEGQLYIVMEFVQGPNLGDILAKSGALDPDRVEKILGQICGSLEEAHAHGIIHRDLKPDNVVLTERAGKKDFVKVLDFGIAKRGGEEDKNEQKLTQQGMVLGTPPYMSPEQFTGKPIDARSDIYALGVMAYEMLTGKLPWTAETPWEWATQHMTVQPYPVSQLPEGMRAPPFMQSAIMKAMAKTPEERFEGVKEFYEAFGNPSGGGTQALAATANAPPGREAVSQRGATLATPQPMMNPMGERGIALGAVQPSQGAYAQGSQGHGAPMQSQGGQPTPMASASATPQGVPQMNPGALGMGGARGGPPASGSRDGGGGGGSGKMIGIGIGGLVVLAAIGGGLFMAFGRGHNAGSGGGAGSTDAGSISTDTTDAASNAGSDDDASLMALTTDAGAAHDAGKVVVRIDAGTKPVAVVDAGGPAPAGHYIPECGYALQMKKIGKTAECQTLAAKCAAAGNVAPSCN